MVSMHQRSAVWVVRIADFRPSCCGHDFSMCQSLGQSVNILPVFLLELGKSRSMFHSDSNATLADFQIYLAYLIPVGKAVDRFQHCSGHGFAEQPFGALLRLVGI